MISATLPYQKKRQTILGLAMAFVDEEQGDPIVFLHGNPTSSYIWRNIIPYMRGLGRCIAPDLIGMGDSQKLPASGPNAWPNQTQVSVKGLHNPQEDSPDEIGQAIAS